MREREPMGNEERLRKALERFADAGNWFDTADEPGGPWPAWRGKGEPEDIASAALPPTEPEQPAGEGEATPVAYYTIRDDGGPTKLYFMDENAVRIWTTLRTLEKAPVPSEPLEPSLQKLIDELKEMRERIRIGEHIYLFTHPDPQEPNGE